MSNEMVRCPNCGREATRLKSGEIWCDVCYASFSASACVPVPEQPTIPVEAWNNQWDIDKNKFVDTEMVGDYFGAEMAELLLSPEPLECPEQSEKLPENICSCGFPFNTEEEYKHHRKVKHCEQPTLPESLPLVQNIWEMTFDKTYVMDDSKSHEPQYQCNLRWLMFHAGTIEQKRADNILYQQAIKEGNQLAFEYETALKEKVLLAKQNDNLKTKLEQAIQQRDEALGKLKLYKEYEEHYVVKIRELESELANLKEQSDER